MSDPQANIGDPTTSHPNTTNTTTNAHAYAPTAIPNSGDVDVKPVFNSGTYDQAQYQPQQQQLNVPQHPDGNIQASYGSSTSPTTGMGMTQHAQQARVDIDTNSNTNAHIKTIQGSSANYIPNAQFRTDYGSQVKSEPNAYHIASPQANANVNVNAHQPVYSAQSVPNANTNTNSDPSLHPQADGNTNVQAQAPSNVQSHAGMNSNSPTVSSVGMGVHTLGVGVGNSSMSAMYVSVKKEMGTPAMTAHANEGVQGGMAQPQPHMYVNSNNGAGGGAKHRDETQTQVQENITPDIRHGDMVQAQAHPQPQSQPQPQAYGGVNPGNRSVAQTQGTGQINAMGVQGQMSGPQQHVASPSIAYSSSHTPTNPQGYTGTHTPVGTPAHTPTPTPTQPQQAHAGENTCAGNMNTYTNVAVNTNATVNETRTVTMQNGAQPALTVLQQFVPPSIADMEKLDKRELVTLASKVRAEFHYFSGALKEKRSRILTTPSEEEESDIIRCERTIREIEQIYPLIEKRHKFVIEQEETNVGKESRPPSASADGSAQAPPATSAPVANSPSPSETDFRKNSTPAVAPAIPSPAKAASEQSILPKRKLDELVEQIDPKEKMDDDVAAFLCEYAEEFIEDVTRLSCMVAKNRRSTTLEPSDISVCLRRNWGLNVPGGGEKALHTRQMVTENHKRRLANISKSIAQTQTQAANAQAQADAKAAANTNAEAEAETDSTTATATATATNTATTPGNGAVAGSTETPSVIAGGDTTSNTATGTSGTAGISTGVVESGVSSTQTVAGTTSNMDAGVEGADKSVTNGAGVSGTGGATAGIAGEAGSTQASDHMQS